MVSVVVVVDDDGFDVVLLRIERGVTSLLWDGDVNRLGCVPARENIDVYLNVTSTRMHSYRMRTVRCGGRH